MVELAIRSARGHQLFGVLTLFGRTAGKRPAWLFWLGFQSSARRLAIASCGGVKRGGNALYPDWARRRWIPAKFVAAIKIDTLVCIGASLPSC